MAGSAWALNTEDGEPQYHARQLRRLMSGLLFPGSNRLGARQGIRPGGSPVVELSGGSWVVRAHQGVLDPGVSSAAGAYLYEIEEHTGSLDPADGSNDRVDIIVVGVRDHDEDSSGEREVYAAYVVGSPGPSPSPPSTPPTAMRLARVEVPAGGSPSLTYEPPYAATSGGILPVDDTDDLPTSGVHAGAYADLPDLGLQRFDGSSWGTAQRGWIPIGNGHVTDVFAWTLDLTDGGRFPPGTFHMMRVYLRGNLDSTGLISVRLNNDDTPGLHRGTLLVRDGAGDLVEHDMRDSSIWRIGHWATVTANTLKLEMTLTHLPAFVAFRSEGERQHSGVNNSRKSQAWGRLNSSLLVDSLRFLTDSDGYSSVYWWAEGYLP